MIRTDPSGVCQVLNEFLERANSKIIIVEDDTETFIAQCFCLEKEFMDEVKRGIVKCSFVWIDAS